MVRALCCRVFRHHGLCDVRVRRKRSGCPHSETGYWRQSPERCMDCSPSLNLFPSLTFCPLAELDFFGSRLGCGTGHGHMDLWWTCEPSSAHFSRTPHRSRNQYVWVQVTLAMSVFRGFPWRRLPGYWLAQLLGGICGAAIVYGNYIRAIDIFEGGRDIRTLETAGLFGTVPVCRTQLNNCDAPSLIFH